MLCGSAEVRFSFRGVCFEHAVYYVLDFCSVLFDRQFLLIDLFTYGKECYKHADGNAACKALFIATLKLCVKVCLVLEIFSMNYSKSRHSKKVGCMSPFKVNQSL